MSNGTVPCALTSSSLHGRYFRYTVVTYTVYGKDIKLYFLWGSWAFFFFWGGGKLLLLKYPR